VGVFLTRLVGGALFAKSQALTSLGLLLALTQSFYWPVVIVVFRQAPDWTPFAMAVLFGSHFLPYAWFYREVTALVAKSRAGAAFAEPTPT
jgi:hypothetical protein